MPFLSSLSLGMATYQRTAALRYELGGDHTYTFVEGVVAHSKAPGNGAGEPCGRLELTRPQGSRSWQRLTRPALPTTSRTAPSRSIRPWQL